MNETEYLKLRIKYLEEVINKPNIPQNLKLNQQNALRNYRNELNVLSRKSF